MQISRCDLAEPGRMHLAFNAGLHVWRPGLTALAARTHHPNVSVPFIIAQWPGNEQKNV